MSEADAKQNIQREIQRRALARQVQQQQQQQQQQPQPQKKQAGKISSISEKASLTSTRSRDTAEIGHDDHEPRRLLSPTFLTTVQRRLLSWKRFSPVTAPAGMKFIGAFLDQDGRRLPQGPSSHWGVPEIAFLGRSNVGKSSLLNKLSACAASSVIVSSSSSTSTGKVQARVGKTPGATASVNLYALVDNKDRSLLVWADLPGYGYAKLSKQTKQAVQSAAEHYLGNSQRPLCLGILLVDIRRTEPTDNDRAVLEALWDRNVPLLVVATKVDKLASPNQREKHLTAIRSGLALPDDYPILAVSTITGEGCKQLWTIILDACETGVEELSRQYKDDSADRENLYYYDDNEEELDEVVDDNDYDDFDDDDDDDEDVQYDQGYDWTRIEDDDDDDDDDSPAFNNGISYSDNHRGDEDDRGDFDDIPGEVIMDPNVNQSSMKRETLKSLKKRVREMERRGEI